MLADLLSQAAANMDAGATVGAAGVSYAQLFEQSLRVASGLADLGIGRDDRIVVALPNGRDLIVSLAAVSALGAVSIPLNPAYRGHELSLYASKCNARGFVVAPEAVTRCASVRHGLGLAAPIVAQTAIDGCDAALSELVRSPAIAAPAPSPPDALAVFLHSSGSTGRSKLIPRTTGQLWAECRNMAATARFTRDDVFLCTVPLFHAHGLGNCLLAALGAHAELVIPESTAPLPARLSALLEIAQSKRVTIWPGTPLIFDLVADQPRDVDLSALRLCISAGTALPRSVFDRMLARSGVPIRQLYGCSEAGAVTLNVDEDVVASAQTAGRPLAGVEVAIDGSGQILFRSAALTAGYLGEDELNRRAFADGWFATGDLGHLDGGGRLCVTGRTRLYIDVGGLKVDPIEIEDVLTQHPGIEEAVVVGVPLGSDGARGEILKAVVVTAAGADLDAMTIRQFCRLHLASFKVPEVVEFRASIPRSPLGKILRKELV